MVSQPYQKCGDGVTSTAVLSLTTCACFRATLSVSYRNSCSLELSDIDVQPQYSNIFQKCNPFQDCRRTLSLSELKELVSYFMTTEYVYTCYNVCEEDNEMLTCINVNLQRSRLSRVLEEVIHISHVKPAISGRKSRRSCQVFWKILCIYEDTDILFSSHIICYPILCNKFVRPLVGSM